MSEAWLLSGFEPTDNEETSRLTAEKKELGFDPRLEAHHLTAKDETAKKSPKRVLDAMTGGNPLRRDQCYKEAPLTLLRTRGEATGLLAFLSEIEAGL